MSTQLKGGIELTANTSVFSTGVGRALESLRKLDTQTNTSAQKTRQLAQASTTLKGPLDTLGMTSSSTAQKIQQLGTATGTAQNRVQQSGQAIRQAQSSIQQYSRAAEGAAVSVQRMTVQTNQAKTAVAGLGTQSGQAAAGMQRMQQSTAGAAQATGRLNAGTIGTAASIGTMGAGIISLEASMSNLNKAQYKVEKSTVAVSKAKLNEQKASTMLLNAENILEKARKNGNKTAEEMQYLEEQVINYREDLALKTEDLKLKQEKLTLANMDQADTQKLMASSIATTVLGTISAATSMIQARAATIASTAATKGNTAATKTNALSQLTSSNAFKRLFFDVTKAKAGFSQITTSMRTTTVAGKTLGPSLRGVAGGIKGVMLSLGPVGIIMTLATSLYAAWETSQQFRDGVMWVIDELQKLWGTLKQVLVPLQWLDDSLKALGINVGENIDQWQDANRTIGETDQTMQEATGTVDELTQYEADMTQQLGELETQTAAAGAATGSFDTAMGSATTAVMAHTSAISADMAMLRSHAGAVAENSGAMLDSHVKSFDSAADAILTHDERLRVNLAGLQNWAKNYKAKMAESQESGAAFVSATETEFSQLAVSLHDDGVDVGNTLERMGASSEQATAILATAFTAAGDTVSDVTGGITTDVDNMAGNVKKSFWDIQKEVTAFMTALKKNETSIELTISNIMNGFRTMSTEAQQMYESAMISNANHIIRAMGGNTSIDSLADALTVTEMYRTNNWANTGQNMQHHGPSERSNEANRLLKKGIYVPDPVGDGYWRQSHSNSFKQSGKTVHTATKVAIWTGSKFAIYKEGTSQFNQAIYGSGTVDKTAETRREAQQIMDRAQGYHGRRKYAGELKDAQKELSELLGISIEKAIELTTLDRSHSARIAGDKLDNLQTQFLDQYEQDKLAEVITDVPKIIETQEKQLATHSKDLKYLEYETIELDTQIAERKQEITTLQTTQDETIKPELITHDAEIIELQTQKDAIQKRIDEQIAKQAQEQTEQDAQTEIIRDKIHTVNDEIIEHNQMITELEIKQDDKLIPDIEYNHEKIIMLNAEKELLAKQLEELENKYDDGAMDFHNWLQERGFKDADAIGVDEAMANDPSIFENEYVKEEYGEPQTTPKTMPTSKTYKENYYTHTNTGTYTGNKYDDSKVSYDSTHNQIVLRDMSRHGMGTHYYNKHIGKFVNQIDVDKYSEAYGEDGHDLKPETLERETTAMRQVIEVHAK